MNVNNMPDKQNIKHKHVPICICISLIFILLFNISSGAATQYHGITITPVLQAKSNWCWAVCAEMAGKSVYSSSSRTQRNIVNHTFQSYDDISATVGQTAAGAQYAAYNRKTF